MPVAVLPLHMLKYASMNASLISWWCSISQLPHNHLTKMYLVLFEQPLTQEMYRLCDITGVSCDLYISLFPGTMQSVFRGLMKSCD